ncbi:hypothetical protein [Pontibacter burrus]|uniref:Lipocalin-like domain-containing protein n=1 Tax=Pontibacter burrus TaxID=2704466 RepID=A0A6B3LX20_9BACT|nr:hypothetical protein [Pontibacter burrus]NEM98160.1 hypothetical protein [Pontibacter burrus]
MRYASFLCLVCLLLLANTCKRASKVEQQLIGKTWLHAFEEDQEDITTYRPNTYDFPPSRGRTGFMLEKGGILKNYSIAPADGLEEQPGTWQFMQDDEILITIKPEGQPQQQYLIKIVSLDHDLLKVKREEVAESPIR